MGGWGVRGIRVLRFVRLLSEGVLGVRRVSKLTVEDLWRMRWLMKGYGGDDC